MPYRKARDVAIDFPPRSIHIAEIELLVEILASITEKRTAVYVSTPITSGRRLVTWPSKNTAAVSQRTHSGEHLKRVKRLNREQAQRIVRKLRQDLEKMVIDPAALVDRPGWTQDDYRHLWALVIERYVETVIFLNGWHYSNGCAYEFMVAKQLGITTLSQKRKKLSLDEGICLIQRSMEEMQSHGLYTGFLERVQEALKKLYNAAGKR